MRRRIAGGGMTYPLFGARGSRREWIMGLAQKFREKGAISPERAMTPLELGLPQRFEVAMKRRLGQTGIFVEVSGGRFYLNEQRLAELNQRWQDIGSIQGARRSARGKLLTLRIMRMIIGVIIVGLFLLNFLYGRTLDVWFLVVALVAVWIGISIYQIFYLARLRNRRYDVG